MEKSTQHDVVVASAVPEARLGKLQLLPPQGTMGVWSRVVSVEETLPACESAEMVDS